MAIRFHQVSVLPATLDPDSFYYVANGAYTEAYLTDNAGVAKSIGNSSMINNLVDLKLAAYSGGIVQDVADITARNALTLDKNALVMVYDATTDPDVTVGAAMYYYDKSADTWTMAAEYESLNIDFSWANIVGKPTSSPAAIDSAVSQAHSHSNKATLDNIGESGAGKATYNGTDINEPLVWDSNDW